MAITPFIYSLPVSDFFVGRCLCWQVSLSEVNLDDSHSICSHLLAWRFVLGVGCGGVYPLAATMTAESSDNQEDGAKAVALTFSMQGVGYLVVPLVAWALLSIFPEDSDMAWRLLLGFGCIPGACLMALRLHRQLVKSPASEDIVVTAKMRKSTIAVSAREVPVSVIDAIQMEANLVRKILGTGGCWFLFDILFYGNTLFQPIVLGAAFGDSETVLKSAMDSSIISALALPGYFISLIAVGRHQSPRSIQSQGFLVMGILYAFIGLYFKALAHEKFLLLSLYGSTFFFSNYGPNATVSIVTQTTEPLSQVLLTLFSS
jgi:PHS family inorganic phosphate transporter-like MFS transporter